MYNKTINIARLDLQGDAYSLLTLLVIMLQRYFCLRKIKFNALGCLYGGNDFVTWDFFPANQPSQL